MKEVGFINSRVEQGRSERQQAHSDDCPAKTEENTGTSDVATEKPPRLTPEERKIIGPVLRNFVDTLSLCRSTLDNRRARTTGIGTDLESEQTLIKLREDSFYVSNVLNELIYDVEKNGCYDVLIREIEEDRKKCDNEIAIERDYDETRKKLADLRETLEAESTANSREREELKEKLFRIKNEKKKLQYKVNIELKYVKAREEARQESSSLRCSIDLKTLEDALENIVSMEKNEHRVAADIAKFLDEDIKAKERAISQWRERYEREMQMTESKNERLSKEIKTMRETLEKLQLEHRERQEFMDTYTAEKEAEEKLRKHEEHRRDCAVRIQSWWRGVMVRRKLGPYRPDERRKKRPTKSKK